MAESKALLAGALMIYGITTEATDFTDELLSDWRVRLIKTILFFLPRANPDNERLYPRVKSWHSTVRCAQCAKHGLLAGHGPQEVRCN